MTARINRRGFVKSSLLASAALPLGLAAQPSPTSDSRPQAAPAQPLPSGKIGDQIISRLIMGGNLIGGYAHSRELQYVSTLMRRYNTPAKIRETLELGEANGITAINTWVQDDNSALFEHWKAGGRIKWIAQARLDPTGGFSQIQRAIDEGAVAVHLTGDTCENLVKEGKVAKLGESLAFTRSRKRVAGLAGHDLKVITASEAAGLAPDFYLKTFHSHDYFTAPKPGETDPVGPNDNSWCQDPQAVIEVMARVKRPWIAFKILAAGAIPPRAAFPYAFNSGADFILVGMFDWQIEENAKLARRVVTITASAADSKRTRPWYG